MKALFLCNEKFLDDSIDSGGVKFCTDEFKRLIETHFTLEEFSVHYTNKFLFRIKKKAGISAYEDYDPQHYAAALKSKIEVGKIEYVFLNLSNTAPFAKLIKSLVPGIKIILCSHGNESGDFLHETVMHQKFCGIKKKSAYYNLGKMLARESEFRHYIDVVLTVSEVEVGIEKWLGANRVFMVPRIIGQENLEKNIIPGRVGFLSDLSHEPNFYGINELCKAIVDLGMDIPEIRLVGSGEERGEELARQFSFVKYLGYLPEEEMKKELATWSFALNPVFYYSRGVSTKLGKCLALGIPVITSKIGMRGYEWKNGKLPMGNTKVEMAEKTVVLSSNKGVIEFYCNEVKKIQSTTPKFEDVMQDILSMLHNP